MTASNFSLTIAASKAIVSYHTGIIVARHILYAQLKFPFNTSTHEYFRYRYAIKWFVIDSLYSVFGTDRVGERERENRLEENI